MGADLRPGPDKIEVWSWVYVDKAAPAPVKEAFRLASLRTFSPSGAFEQDDMDNWQECTRTCRGVVSRRYALHYGMGLGHEGFNLFGDSLRDALDPKLRRG